MPCGGGAWVRERRLCCLPITLILPIVTPIVWIIRIATTTAANPPAITVGRWCQRDVQHAAVTVVEPLERALRLREEGPPGGRAAARRAPAAAAAASRAYRPTQRRPTFRSSRCVGPAPCTCQGGHKGRPRRAGQAHPLQKRAATRWPFKQLGVGNWRLGVAAAAVSAPRSPSTPGTPRCSWSCPSSTAAVPSPRRVTGE
jgi:hypothetical protein